MECPAGNKKLELQEHFDNQSDLITICIPENIEELMTIASMLQSNGITFYLKTAKGKNYYDPAQIGTGFNFTTQMVEIQVNSSNLKQAELVIEDFEGSSGFRRNIQGINNLQESNQHFAESLFQQGTEFYEQGEYPQAEAKLLEAQRILPDSYDIKYNLVLVYIAQKKINSAWDLVKKTAINDRKILVREIKKVEKTLFEDFCPVCDHFSDEDGICYKLHENIKRYPHKFIKKCDGESFKKNLNKYLRNS